MAVAVGGATVTASPSPNTTTAGRTYRTSGASPRAAEARANHTVPIRYTFRLPKRSPSAAPISRAMLTTVASRAAIPEPSTLTASTHRPDAEEYERPGASTAVMARAGSGIAWCVLVRGEPVRCGRGPGGTTA